MLGLALSRVAPPSGGSATTGHTTGLSASAAFSRLQLGFLLFGAQVSGHRLSAWGSAE